MAWLIALLAVAVVSFLVWWPILRVSSWASQREREDEDRMRWDHRTLPVREALDDGGTRHGQVPAIADDVVGVGPVHSRL
jgi:hypothetical protein